MHRAFGRILLSTSIMLTLGLPRPGAAATGFGVGPLFRLDTRIAGGESHIGVSPPFELSTLVIGGRVLSPAGDPLPATVRADGITTQTDADGSFVVAGVKPGQRYAITVLAAGYQTGSSGEVTVAAGRSVRDLELRLSPADAGPRRVVELWPPNEVASSIMQGGTAVRYLRVIDETGQARPGSVIRTDGGQESLPSDEDGVVSIAVPATPAPGGRQSVRIVSVDGQTQDPPLAFDLQVQPRTYEVLWESDGYSRVGISFVNVERGRGNSLRLTERDGDLTGFEDLEIGREVRSGVGAVASLGAVAGVRMSQVGGVKVEAGAAAEATAEGMLSTISEDRYAFPYGQRSATQAMAQYALIADGMVGSLSPHLVNLLAFVETRLTGNSDLQGAYAYGGRSLDAMAGVRAKASAGAAATLGDNARAGLLVGVDARGEGHGTLTWAEYPHAGEAGLALGLTAKGRVRGRAEAGMIVSPAGRNELGAAAFAGAGAGGLVGG